MVPGRGDGVIPLVPVDDMTLGGELNRNSWQRLLISW